MTIERDSSTTVTKKTIFMNYAQSTSDEKNEILKALKEYKDDEKGLNECKEQIKGLDTKFLEELTEEDLKTLSKEKQNIIKEELASKTETKTEKSKKRLNNETEKILNDKEETGVSKASKKFVLGGLSLNGFVQGALVGLVCAAIVFVASAFITMQPYMLVGLLVISGLVGLGCAVSGAALGGGYDALVLSGDMSINEAKAAFRTERTEDRKDIISTATDMAESAEKIIKTCSKSVAALGDIKSSLIDLFKEDENKVIQKLIDDLIKKSNDVEGGNDEASKVLTEIFPKDKSKKMDHNDIVATLKLALGRLEKKVKAEEEKAKKTEEKEK